MPVDIQEHPLLAASFFMETAPMASKLWQSSHEPLHDREGKQVPATLINLVEKFSGRIETRHTLK